MLTVTMTVTGDSMSDIEAGLDEIQKSLAAGYRSGGVGGEDNQSYLFDVGGFEVLFSSDSSPKIRQNIRRSFINYGPGGRRFTVEYDADRGRWWIKIAGRRRFAVLAPDAGDAESALLEFEEV